MKRKNGFTLIELLAIIVILAIIAVITVPIILNIIDESKKGAAKDSAYGYKDAVGNYYLSRLAQNSGFNIDDDIYTTDELKDEGVTVEGNEPGTNSWVEIINNTVINGCLQFDEFMVEITDGNVGSAIKSQCEDITDIPAPVSFATDSWATINKSVKDGDLSKYSIGDEKDVLLSGIGTFKVRIVNTSTPSECSDSSFSQTACGFVVEFVDAIGSHYMNPSTESSSYGTGEGGWEQTSMRRYLNTDNDSIYSKLPSDLKRVIVSTNPVVSSSGNNTTSLNTSDKLFLLALKEVGISSSNDNKSDKTRTLDYYSNNNTNDARKKKLNNSYVKWYLRSGYSETYECLDCDNYYFFAIADYGSWSNPLASESFAVVPAFRVGK